MVYDRSSQSVIIAGMASGRNDFAPAENDHGFAVAIDLDGNWKWSKFFYNVSYSVSSIQACSIAPTSTEVVLAGFNWIGPVLMTLDVTSGEITSFAHLESGNIEFDTSSAAIASELNSFDKQAVNVYASFGEGDEISLIKV